MGVKAKRLIKALFDAFMEDAALLPTEYRDAAIRKGTEGGDADRARIVADYIAGMTDRFAISEHARVFDPKCVS